MPELVEIEIKHDDTEILVGDLGDGTCFFGITEKNPWVESGGDNAQICLPKEELGKLISTLKEIFNNL